MKNIKSTNISTLIINLVIKKIGMDMDYADYGVFTDIIDRHKCSA